MRISAARLRMYIFILIVISVFILGLWAIYNEETAPQTIYSAKEFLFEYPDIKLKIDNSEWYDKYTKSEILNGCRYSDTVISLKINEQEYEIYLNANEQKVGPYDQWVIYEWCGYIKFRKLYQ